MRAAGYAGDTTLQHTGCLHTDGKYAESARKRGGYMACVE